MLCHKNGQMYMKMIIISEPAVKIINKHNVIDSNHKLQTMVILSLDLYVFLGCYLPIQLAQKLLQPCV